MHQLFDSISIPKQSIIRTNKPIADGSLRLKARSSLSVIDNYPQKLTLEGYMSEGNYDPHDLVKKLAREKQER